MAKSAAARTGRKQGRKPLEPERRCIVTGRHEQANRLVRFVVGPGGQIVPDLARKLPGRGLWVSADKASIEKALARGLFARAAKAPVEARQDLAQQVEKLLRQRCLAAFGLALRAGRVVCGFEKVLEKLSFKKLGAVIEASDGALDGRKKIFRRMAGLEREPVVIGCFNASELGLALGREYVVHAGLEKGGLTDNALIDLGRLAGFVELCPPEWGEIPGRRGQKSGPEQV